MQIRRELTMKIFPARHRWITAGTLGSLALLMLVLGAAARPLFITDKASPTPILNATEIGFLQDMLAHHQQALILVQRLSPDADPTVRRLAQQIADNQRVEIGMMLGWLRLANAVPTNPHPMAWMHDPGESAMPGHGHQTPSATASPVTTMPGMASLQRHHYGGVTMAQAADPQLTGGQVKLAARDMISTQSQEIGVIGMLLAQRGALG
ncbi:uncharacterized protein (DUF305 family) [Nocardia sp. GAS34]|uniref:DUF305 domain-containing protein n=1 Tax=unclassified Nocardia TaxID=2637762 RepID=UPI003D242AA1